MLWLDHHFKNKCWFPDNSDLRHLPSKAIHTYDTHCTTLDKTYIIFWWKKHHWTLFCNKWIDQISCQSNTRKLIKGHLRTFRTVERTHFKLVIKGWDSSVPLLLYLTRWHQKKSHLTWMLTTVCLWSTQNFNINR